MDVELRIEMTADGSPTLYRADIDEHYHSVKGAVAESRHVYLGLCFDAAALRRDNVTVFEVGFGTGLNAALTAAHASELRIRTRYISVELYPVPSALTDAFGDSLSVTQRNVLADVNKAPWNQPVEINPYFILEKSEADLLSMEIPAGIDAVYFDAFAPDKQPEMWDEAVFRKLYAAMSPGGVLTTYCAKGTIRRLLQSVGFKTERLQGPPGGKREVLRARKLI